MQPRVVEVSRRSRLLIFVAAAVSSFFIRQINAECWFAEDMHEEGAEVATAEPCLNCTCNKGVLLCYLRVCPKLPNPPPPGCVLLHRYRRCCPELLCSDFGGGGNDLEARSDPDGDSLDLMLDLRVPNNACIANGTIYAPGSAMDSSSLCEYCFCLGGKQTCVRPKCLLSMDDCRPVYDSTSCCPVHYNCTRTAASTTTTERLEERGNACDALSGSEDPRSSGPGRDCASCDRSRISSCRNFAGGGCLVDGTGYLEGVKVLGSGYAACDNCYCTNGVLRCEPLDCAPPLLGCAPVIRPGECCAASYNCSGTIETQPEPYYGNFPIVSKEYAKLIKANQRKSPTRQDVVTVFPETSPSAHRNPGTSGTTRHFGGSTTNPFHRQSTRSHVPESNRNYKRVLSTTTSTTTTESGDQGTTTVDENEESPDYVPLISQNFFSFFESLLDDDDNNSTVTEETTSFITPTEGFTDSITQTTTVIADDDGNTVTNTEPAPTTVYPYPLTMKSVLTSTDCISWKDNTLESPESNEVDVTTHQVPVDLTTLEGTTMKTTTMPEVEAFKAATLRNMPDVEAILNMSKSKEEDYEYDYNESSLPPSLPNLKIIPFVAADAVDPKKEESSKEEQKSVYESKKVADPMFGYANLFSPPAETEGGFIPKDPPILGDNFYENAVTVSISENESKPLGYEKVQNDTFMPLVEPLVRKFTTPERIMPNCMNHEGIEVLHGESVPSPSSCVTCTCLYGNIVCQNPNCPIPESGCRRSAVQDHTLCCPLYICEDGLSQEVSQGVLFRDVIRTEPPPNLQSLISDMMPFLTRRTSTSTTTTTQPPPTAEDPTTTGSVPQESTTTLALLINLAGCNIYGRMYRVGRIISELSGPCLECKCTEVGVQCKPLNC